MSVHGQDHEEFLIALLDQEPLDQAELERRLGACATCRAAWKRLREAHTRLEQAAAQRRSALEDSADSARGEVAPGEAELLASLERLALHEPHARRRWPNRRWLVAAALLFAGAWLAWRARGIESPRTPTWLGQNGLELLEPLDEVPSFARFAWNYNGEASAFTLRIYRERDGRRGELLFEDPACKGTTWTPETSFLAAGTARISWEVFALDEFGGLQDGASGSAWLSSR